MAAVRTDIHRPKTFNPEDYRIVGWFDAWRDYRLPEPALKEETALKDLLDSNPRPHGPTYSRCDHCGTLIRYVAVTHHAPSGDYLAIGQVCAEERIGIDKKAYDLARVLERVEAVRTAQRNREYREQFAQDHPQLFEFLQRIHDDPHDNWLDIQIDIARRFFSSKPQLSTRQIEVMYDMMARRERWEKRRAERQAREEELAKTAEPAPFGAKGVEIVGRLVKRDIRPSDFAPNGVREVCTVETVQGYKVWGTLPRGLDADEGDWVKFTADLDDRRSESEFFAFFKRPRKAQRLDAEPDLRPTCSQCWQKVDRVTERGMCEPCDKVMPF